MPNTLIAHEDGANLKITGMTDVADDLKELIGTAKEAREIVLEKSASASLEQALVEGLRSAREVLGSYVKFAKPIVLKGVVPVAVTEKLAGIKHSAEDAPEDVEDADTAPTSKPRCPGGKIRSGGKGRGLGMGGGQGPRGVPMGAKAQIDPAIISMLEQLMKYSTVEGMEKAAASPFVKRLFAQIDGLKVNGTEVGINMPCKVSFDNTASRDLFLALFPKQASTFSIDELAGQLVAEGLVKGGVAERLAAAGVSKHAKVTATRRKNGRKS